MATQVSLNSGAVASAGALALQTDGTTEAVSISTGQVATLAQNPILTSGTANGVAYLNGSKAVTSGSALTFDGSNLGLGVTPSAWQSGFRAMQLSGLASWNVDGSTAGSGTYFGNNVYRDSADSRWEYLVTGDNATQYLQASGQHIWRTSASGTAGNAITFTQAMTLDASGNLLVGTTSQIGGSRINFYQPNASTDMKIGVGVATGTNAAYQVFVNNTVTTIGTENSSGGSLVSGSSAYSTVIANSGAYPLSFGTNNTERARIDSSGNLLVGATSNALTAARLLVQTASDYQLTVNASTSSGAVYSAINFTQAGAGKGAIYQDHANTRLTLQCNGSGGVYLASGATSWTANSDERLKDIIEPITDATNKVSSLRAVIGKYKTDEEGTRRSFLIAQDVQSVLPEAVTSGTLSRSEDTTEYLGVAYTDVIPLLVAAIKEQNQLIQSLTDRISALESK